MCFEVIANMETIHLIWSKLTVLVNLLKMFIDRIFNIENNNIVRGLRNSMVCEAYKLGWDFVFAP